ncbi:MAG: hypothetical protein GKR98_00325 [Boseongicola sp.]|nr:MAG: hypothetical protein GKR98_00325 [Boseongicola sp.]
MTHIHQSVTIDAPLEMVWEYFTDSAKIAEWLMPNTFRSELGAGFTMDCPPGIGSGAPVECEIRDITAPNDGEARLVYTWIIDQPHTETLLEVSFRQIRDTTHVDVVHSGWEDGESDLRTRHAMGWQHLLGVRLRACIE